MHVIWLLLMAVADWRACWRNCLVWMVDSVWIVALTRKYAAWMYLFGVPLQNDSTFDTIPGKSECDGCAGSRRIRMLLSEERMAMSRHGSLRVVLLKDEGDSTRSGDWNIAKAVLRSPVAWAIVPAEYSIKHRTVIGRASFSPWAVCRSSFKLCVANSQSVRVHARNTCCKSTAQYSVLRHSMRLFALTIDSVIGSGVCKPPMVLSVNAPI